MRAGLDTDTIVAIATSPGRGGIGVIRLSGPEALSIAQRVCAKEQALEPRVAHFCKFLDQSGETLDNGLWLCFPGPGSFTGCLLYTSPSPRDLSTSRMPSSA